MMPLSHPLEGQPYLPDVHPYACDCPACDDPTEKSWSRIGLECVVGTAAALIIGQLLGVMLERSGFLSAIGIG